MEFKIPEENIERLRKKAEKIKRKCEKLGCPFTYEETGEEYETCKDKDGNEITVRYILVTAEGRAEVNGWQFVGTVEHTEKGNIISCVRGEDAGIPKIYYDSRPFCEHCRKVRYRKSTFLLRNEERGEYVQVGKNCLRDFTGGMSVEGVSMYESFIHAAEEAQISNGSHIKPYYDVVEWLHYVAETIRHFGYVRNQNSYDEDYDPTVKSTAQRAFEYWRADHGRFRMDADYVREIREEMAKVGFDENSRETISMTDDALSWLDTQLEDKSVYVHNLKVACGLRYTNGKNLGLLASLFPSYKKDLEIKLERKKRAEKEQLSEHVGDIGERVTFVPVKAEVVTSWETQFGVTMLWKITSEDGNIFIWKTSNDVREDTSVITGTVKEHTEFRGVKQTVLTRCRQTTKQTRKGGNK